MDFNKIYVVLGSDVHLEEQDINQLINNTFVREFQEGRKWGKVIQDAVTRNVDLKTQDFLGPAMDDEKNSTLIARQVFTSIAPHIDPDSHINFVIMNQINKEGKDHAVILYFVLE